MAPWSRAKAAGVRSGCDGQHPAAQFRSNFSFKRRSSNDEKASNTDTPIRTQRFGSGSSPAHTALKEQEAGEEDSPSRRISDASWQGSVSSTDVLHKDGHARQKRVAEAAPLGLNVVYSPSSASHKADIVFVHGLGGTSRNTWSKHKKPELFWPLQFLPQEPDISQARILTFGYNANFSRKGSTGTSILDFAKDLLFDLKYAHDVETTELSIGSVPLIFVVHSMGGLIIKEAYIQGQNDPEYENIIKAISGITFLATPHRGTNLATLLNRILSSTLLSNSKQYISDLNQNSVALQKLNDQFRHIAPKLDIVSFYETRPTPIGLKNAAVMILERDTSILGYPGETSKALDADHHNVCKYDSQQDPNYIVVRNVLKSLVSKILTKQQKDTASQNVRRRSSRDLKSLLGISEMPDTDYIFFRDQWMEGTGEWIFQDTTFLQWLDPGVASSTSKLLLLHGGPGTGKSVISSCVINDLAQRGLCCQYFFIRASDKKKRTMNTLLRALVYQLARSVPLYLDKALSVADEGLNLETADPRTIWERLFRSVLPHVPELPQPLYWVLDGIDEGSDPRNIIKMFSDPILAAMNIRILFVGRGTSEILGSFSRVPVDLQPTSIAIEGRIEDMHHYIVHELHMAASPEYQSRIAEELIDRSRNNFLWVRLAVEALNLCHTQADVDAALDKLPAGMEALYDGMASKILNFKTITDRDLAVSMLRYACVAVRTLNLAEFAQALQERTSTMLDVEKSVSDLCAGFVVIDNDGNVAMIHETAREYLLDPEVDRSLAIHGGQAHEDIFMSCMRSLMGAGLRQKILEKEIPVFYDYSATSWSKHLIEAHSYEQSLFDCLSRFLNGQFVLTWIHYLSSTGQLNFLVRASRHLAVFFSRRRQQDITSADTGGKLLKLAILEGWSTDLVKLVGKFGVILREEPESIYKVIAPFCPATSAIWQVFGKAEARNLSIQGLATDQWDDSLARISPANSSIISQLVAAGSLIAILSASGTVLSANLYNSTTFEPTSSSDPISHGERVQRMELNATGTMLATYGFRTTKIWDTKSGTCVIVTENEPGKRPLALAFTPDSSQLVAGTDDRRLRSLDLQDQSPSWAISAELDEEEMEGLHLNAASFVAISRDVSLVAVASRGHPPSAWEVGGPYLLQHCWRTVEQTSFGQIIDAAWNPNSPELFGLYYEGVLFRWRPYEDDYEELNPRASRLSISKDGNLIATGDSRGAVKIFSTTDMSLLYQSIAESTVLGLAFSPDSRRLYDFRGRHANVWEPNALLRFAEQREKDPDGASDIESVTMNSTASIAVQQGCIGSVTALSACPMGVYYAVGTENGAVDVCNARTSVRSNVYRAKSFFSIEHMAWSNDGRLLAFSFAGKRVIVVSLEPDKHDRIGVSCTCSVRAEFSLKADGKNTAISQLLFSSNSSELAITWESYMHIVSTESFEVTQAKKLKQALRRVWLLHPTDPALLIGVAAGYVTISDWSLSHEQIVRYGHPDLELKSPAQDVSAERYDSHPRKAENDLMNSSSLEDGIIERVTLSTGRSKLFLVQILVRTGVRRKLFLSLDAALLQLRSSQNLVSETSMSAKPEPLAISAAHYLPPKDAQEIGTVLGFLARERMVILSRKSAIRLWQASVPPASMSSRKPDLAPHKSMSTVARPLAPISTNRPTASRQLSLPERLHTRSSATENGNRALVGTSVAIKNPWGSEHHSSQPVRKSSNVVHSPFRTLFYLSGDWIGNEEMGACVFWAKEKALLCPRNGEVAVVRCLGLA